MKILWLNWKDKTHPAAGGAEVVLHELARRQVADGHQVALLTERHAGATAHDTIDGVTVIRVGRNRYTHTFAALWHYVRRMRGQYDVVISVVNTAPYFVALVPDAAKKVLFYHQLAREIWFHETPFPLNTVGYYLLEPAATRLLALRKAPTLTISASTKADLQRFGFRPENTKVITQGNHVQPVQDLAAITKLQRPTMLSLGAMRSMKRTLDQISAFEIAKTTGIDLQLKIAGDARSPYGAQVLARIADSPFAADIEYLGRVTDQQKTELMRTCHFIAVTSLKEGWGLIVTEAASQGTPAIVYDLDGLRDSVVNNTTGIVTEPSPRALAKGIHNLLSDPQRYDTLRRAAWQASKHYNFDQSYKELAQQLEAI